MRCSSFSTLVLSVLVLSACTSVDTTGVSPESTKPSHGLPSAAISIIEYGDFECPACKVSHETVVRPFLQDAGSDVQFTFRQFPLRAIHRFAFDAAVASECAADQGKFWEFVDMAYERQETLSTRPFLSWAGELSLNEDLFSRCIQSGFKKKIVEADIRLGEADAVRGTPAFVVNGQNIGAVSLEGLRSVVEQARTALSGIAL